MCMCMYMYDDDDQYIYICVCVFVSTIAVKKTDSVKGYYLVLSKTPL